MSYTNSIEKLLEIQDIFENKIENNEKNKEIHITLKRKEHQCPCCGHTTDKIHDYRVQRIKDIDILGKRTVIVLKKRRYCCPKCGKKFYEETPWLGRYARMTNRKIMAMLEELTKTVTYKHVAEDNGVSSTTVMRIFDHISYPHPKLPVTLSIDEFKGNTGGEKYNCIIADPLNHTVLDILPKRYDWYINDYFRKHSKAERDRVQIFVSDMWKPYQDAATSLFTQSKRVIDKYHWCRQIVWAFERVRKDVQKHLSKDYRIYFKHSRKLLLKPFNLLDDTDKQAVNIMLYASPTLSTAHFYKEKFQNIMKSDSRSKAKTLMDNWIEEVMCSDIKPMVDCAKTMNRWKSEILDSFTTSCTNGFVEGCNNKIKVLKRISYGCRNFRRFRNRILHIFSDHVSPSLS